MDINDFQQGTPLTVGDFDNFVKSGVAINERSASQIAAITSIMGDGDPEKYRETKAQIMDPQQQDTFFESQKRVREFLMQDAKEALPSLLADTSIEDSTKLGVVTGVRDRTVPPSTSLDILSQEALIADNGYNETERTADYRLGLIDDVESINKQKAQLTSMINGLGLMDDQGTVGTIVDVAELVTPFAEWLHMSDLLTEAEKTQSATGDYTTTLTVLGEQRQKLYDLFSNTPINERMAFAQTMIDLMEGSSNVVLPDGNALLALNDLQRMFMEDEYSNTERWIDNISSILDVVGAGSLFRTASKTNKVVNAPTKSPILALPKPTLAEEAIAFERRQREATKEGGVLSDEAKAFKGSAEPTVDEVFKPKPKIDNSPKKLAEEAKKFKAEAEPTIDTLFREAVSEKTRTDVVPTSPAQTVKDFNPELARQLHSITAKDETGEAAKAMYGASREEALAKDILPEPGIKEGTIPNKVEMRRPDFEEPEAIKKARLKNGNTIVSEKEMGTIVKNKLLPGFEEVEGMVLHPASLVARTNLDGTIGFTARYSPIDSGFKTAQEALENAKAAFRHYGLQDENFTLVYRKGSEWKEVKQQDLAKATVVNGNDVSKANYAIALKYDYRFSPTDWDEASLLTTAPGVVARMVQTLDAIPTQWAAKAGQGSLVQNLLDAASVIHPQILNAAYVAVDRVYGLRKLYVDEFKGFAKSFSKLAKPRQALMTDYIHKANLEGIALDVKKLYAQGFTEQEVKLLKDWRRANDIMWYAANQDMVASLRARDISVFTHQASGTKLFGRPMGERSAAKADKIFNPTTNSVGDLDGLEVKKLYEEGGTLFKLVEPVQIDNHWVDIVVSPNKSTSGYVRKIYDDETVLAYRDGYYPVMYDANYFLTKKVKKANNEEYFKVIASARNKNEVKAALKKIKAADPEGAAKGLYDFRLDRALHQQTSGLLDEGSWRIAANSGLTSQRVRGERLMEAGVDLQKMGNAHLKDPLEAVANQIQQLSQRVAMRPLLDAMKRRWMLNYGKYLDLPTDTKTGQLAVPSTVADIKRKSGAPLKMEMDARTNFNYIASLENGYINLIDEGFRAVMNVAAQFVGEKGFGKFEEALFGAAKLNPTQKARSAAFKFFISASPLRQALIQRGQILQLGAINPSYLVRHMAEDLSMINLVKTGAFDKSNTLYMKKYLDLFEEIRTSGILEAVDAHTLARTDMLHLADLSTGQKVKNVLGKPFEISQRVGFDPAEQDVLLSSWLAHRDLAIKAGKNIKSQRVQDEILGQARAFTLGMNRAGDMPYSQNTLGMAAQFFSFRHKAVLQTISNRSLSPKDRLKLLAYTTAMFGVDATLITAGVYSVFGESGVPSETKDKIRDGMLDTTLNYALTLASGEDQAIDFGDFAPVEAYGIGNVFLSMIGTPLSDIIIDTPSGSLLFGNSPRLTDAFKTMMRYFNIADDYDDPEMETKFVDVVKASASVFSGFSSAFKASYAFKTNQKMSSTGRITDADVTSIEAILATFGFRTKTETGYARVREMQYGDKPFEDDDAKLWYKELKRHLARRGVTPIERDMSIRILQEAYRVFNDDRPRLVETIIKEIEKDAVDGDFMVLKGLMGSAGFITESDLWELVNNLPAGKVRDEAVFMLKTRGEMNDGE